MLHVLYSTPCLTGRLDVVFSIFTLLAVLVLFTAFFLDAWQFYCFFQHFRYITKSFMLSFQRFLCHTHL